MRKRKYAITHLFWGKSPYKRYTGVAGKGGNTTNGTYFNKEDSKNA